MTGDPAEIPIPEALRTQYRVSFIRFQSPTAALFEGVDPEHGRTVLVKVMRPDPTTSPADRQRVRRELQKLVQVRHPVLVPILDLGEEADLTWIIRPFVVGETLAERIAARGRLSPEEAATLGLHLAAGLGELHRHGLLHRDLRPGHVLLGQDGGVYLIDAGLGRTFVSPDGRALVGCPGYAAPEAILGRLMSFRSDLYGLGAVLYEALSGMPPYMALDPRRMMQLQCEADPEPLDPSVPSALTRLVSTLLARDPRERPMSAQVVERQLEAMVPSIPPATPDADVELGERTVMTDGLDAMLGAGVPAYAPPPAFAAHAYRESTPPPLEAYEATTSLPVDVPLPAPVAKRPPTASPEPDAVPLDFEDVVDTNQNEASRVFGIPAGAPGVGGSAIPPLSQEAAAPIALAETEAAMARFPAYEPAPGHGAPVAPPMAPPPFGEAPVPPSGPAQGAYPMAAPPTNQAPGFEAPASHTVAMEAPPPAAFMNYGQPMQGQPMQGQPMQGQPMQGQPMQGQPQWTPYGPAMGGPPPNTGMPGPSPTAPTSRGAGLLVALVALVAFAGFGGYLMAKVRRGSQPTTPSTTVATPETSPEGRVGQPPMPTLPSPMPDASAQTVTDVASTVDVATVAPSEPEVPSVAAEAPEAGPPEMVPPPPRPEVAPPAPVVRVAPVRPVLPRPIARPTAVARPAADAGVATSPLTEAIRRQDWPTARRLLTEALRARPNDAASHAQLGYVLDRLGDAPGALREYRSATRLDRRNTRYLHRLADLQVATGDRPGAIATLQQILRINPAEPAARARLEQMQAAH